MRLFKRRKKEETKPVFEFGDYKLLLNIKTICFFEEMTDKSFLEMDDEEDMIYMLYAMFIMNNDVSLSYEGFKYFLEDERVLKWFLEKSNDIKRRALIIQHKGGEEEKVDKKPKISDIASTLIIKYKMDVEYVMYKMELWEITQYTRACENLVKEEYTYDRLWTYLTMLPHIDGKKVKGPEGILPFPWEKENNKQEEFEKNAAAALSFLSKNTEIEDGEGRPDTDTEREGTGGGTEATKYLTEC